MVPLLPLNFVAPGGMLHDEPAWAQQGGKTGRTHRPEMLRAPASGLSHGERIPWLVRNPAEAGCPLQLKAS